MTTATEAELYYDPYSVELNMDPYAVFARLREEAPLYYNEQQDFYALSRFDDVNKAVIDHETFISGRGALLEIIKSGMEIPPGTLIFEDPPIHSHGVGHGIDSGHGYQLGFQSGMGADPHQVFIDRCGQGQNGADGRIDRIGNRCHERKRVRIPADPLGCAAVARPHLIVEGI